MPLNGARIEELRERRGLTIAELADGTDVGSNTIWRWIHGKSQPSAIRLARLAEVLKTSSAYIMGDTDDPTPASRLKTNLTDDEFRLLDAYRRGDWRFIMRLLAGDE